MEEALPPRGPEGEETPHTVPREGGGGLHDSMYDFMTTTEASSRRRRRTTRREGPKKNHHDRHDGYLVVKEGGVVVRAESEDRDKECDPDASLEAQGTPGTSRSPPPAPSSSRPCGASGQGSRKLVHALTTTHLERLRRSAASNYVDISLQRFTPSASVAHAQPTASSTSTSTSTSRCKRRSSSASRPPSLGLPSSSGGRTSYSTFSSGEASLYATPAAFDASFDGSLTDSSGDDSGEEETTTRLEGKRRRSTQVFGISRVASLYSLEDLTLVPEEGEVPPEMSSYGDKLSSFTSTDDEDDDEDVDLSDEYDEDQEVVNLEEEWDTSEEEEQERLLQSIDRGPDLVNHTAEGSVWNQRFQELVKLDDEDETRYKQLAHLAHDFQHAAEVYGRIIISERFLSVEQKTIKPLDIGGIAGGEKFTVQGILFKYALDTQLIPGIWMYGGDFPDDSAAMKAAGHELRSLARIEDSAHARAEGLMLPLETVVDYRGFRLLAVSVLPISRKTIVYGSHDGGRTVHATYPLFNRKFKAVFSGLNLKGHRVCNKFLYGPGDIEGHWGGDGQLYLLDFSRVYPPEDIIYVRRYFPAVSSRGLFYRMLRPELVYSYPVPLCSDSYSRWIAADKNAHTHNLEVSEATRWLLERVIPDLTLELVFRCIKLNPDEFSVGESGIDVYLLHEHALHILHRMHTCGVNMRYLGLLRHKFIDTARNYLVEGSGMESVDTAANSVGMVYSSIIFTEMAARVAKNIIRALLREKMKQLKVPSSEPYRQLVLLLFNLFSGHHRLSSKFWTVTKPSPLSSLKNETPNAVNEHQVLEEDRGLEYYIYQQSLRRKNNAGKISKTEKLSCFRMMNNRASLRRTAPLAKSNPRQENAGLKRSADTESQDGHDSEENEFNKAVQPVFSPNWVQYHDDDELLSQLLPMKLAIRAKFGHLALEQQEWNSTARDKPLLFQGLFFYRVCEMLGILMSNQPTIFQELNATTLSSNTVPAKFEFLDPHLLDLSVKVKHMHLIASCEGMALFMKSARLIEEKICLTEEERKKCILLLTFAREKFEFALKSITDSVYTLLHLAKVVYFLASYSTNSSGSVREGASASRRQISDSNGGRRKEDTSAANNKRILLEASLKYFEQAINILKKRDSMATMLAKKKASTKTTPVGSLGNLRGEESGNSSSNLSNKLASQQEKNERRNKKQIDVDQDLMCRATLEMLGVLCELSMLFSTVPVQGSADGSIPRERRRLWGSAWDLLQEMMMKYPAKFKRAFQDDLASLLRGHGSTLRLQRNACPLFNYLNVDRVGVVIASAMKLQSLRIIHERMVQAYYHEKKERNKQEREMRESFEKAKAEQLEEEKRRRLERRDELRHLATFQPLRRSLDTSNRSSVYKRTEVVIGSDSYRQLVPDEPKGEAREGGDILMQSRDDTQLFVKKSTGGDGETGEVLTKGQLKNSWRRSMVDSSQLLVLRSKGDESTRKPNHEEDKQAELMKKTKGKKPKEAKKSKKGKGKKKHKKSRSDDGDTPEDLDGTAAFYLHLSSGASRGEVLPPAAKRTTGEEKESEKMPSVPKSDSGSGGSESEPEPPTEGRSGGGRIGLLKSLQKRRMEGNELKTRKRGNNQLKKAKTNTLRRRQAESNSEILTESKSMVIPVSHSLEEQLKEKKSLATPPKPALGSSSSFHTATSFVARYISRPDDSFASAFKEHTRRFTEYDASSFFFSSLFDDRRSSATATSAQANSVLTEPGRGQQYMQNKSLCRAEKFRSEDTMLSWGSRYLATKSDGNVYLTSTISRDTIWWVESCEPIPVPEGEEVVNVALRSSHGKYLTLSDPVKGTIAALSARFIDQARWEWMVAQTSDSHEAMNLRTPQTHKILCPANKRSNTVTATKDSVYVHKGEYWSIRLANVNRVYLRTAAYGKYLRSRHDEALPTKNQVTTPAFVPSYIYDSWWIELHPTDPRKAALRSHEGSFLIPQWTTEKRSPQQPLQNVEVKAVSTEPYYFTIIPYDHYTKEEERRQAREERQREGQKPNDDRSEHDIDTELSVVLYAERDKSDKGTGGFLSVNERGPVHLATLPVPGTSSQLTSSASAFPTSSGPASSSGGEDNKSLEAAVWIMRWYNPKWPRILAMIYSELELKCGSPLLHQSSSSPPSASPPSPLTPVMNSSLGGASTESPEPENSPFLSLQIQAVLQRMVDRARFHVHV